MNYVGRVTKSEVSLGLINAWMPRHPVQRPGIITCRPKVSVGDSTIVVIAALVAYWTASPAEALMATEPLTCCWEAVYSLGC